MCKLSVIIPIHNTETVLKRCLDSVLGQGFDDMELLLVDDGSTDGSGAICDAYAEKDSRVSVFHKPFAGASAARNVGIEHAQGEWIAFVDSDDYVDTGYFELPYEAGIDLYARNWKSPQGDMGSDFSSSVVEGDTYWDFLRDTLHHLSIRTMWCFVIKKTILDANGIRFDERFHLGEDTLFMLDCYPCCNTLKIVDGPCYRYDRSENWEEKHIVSWKEVEPCLDVFMDKYDNLSVEAPRLPALMFGLCRVLIDKNEKQMHRKWLCSAPVKRFIESQLPSKGRIFKLKYWAKEIIRR